ncbi:hypothetical protein CC78DRAFT_522025 [Lojkania enalia]|uniref:DUF4396 domain-containing protein n=1 Tax=Lojkania enalia TaxID=147567 RepID=A0A9P4K742_9PLEO|nr:hypothetical protein CC78DRAFT_522025 [Didymosphaeria enalia]
MENAYEVPVSLTTIGTIFIASGAAAALWIAGDIAWRRGWKSMMWIMIPVYVINATYLWPITVWVYINYGRPPKRVKKHSVETKDAHHPPHGRGGGEADEGHGDAEGGECGGHHFHEGGSQRPMFATITVAVCHCGAGCVLGDVVGEWLHGADFGFAIGFGLLFQYFSIAPMSGQYGMTTLYRALKADFLSLIFFEIGLFGWMAAFQVGIFEWRLEMNNVLYWWMMQIGMFFGHWTAVPVNWWLITKGIKEPCA